MSDLFRRFAMHASVVLGSPLAFIVALMVLIVWGISGPIFNFSDTWQLIINTSTTIVTFLMVFIIQNTQNRDAQAIHLKLDELIHATHGARNKVMYLEKLPDEELERMAKTIMNVHKERHLKKKKR